MFTCNICQKSISSEYNLKLHFEKCEKLSKEKNKIIKDYVENSMSIRDLEVKYNFTNSNIRKILKINNVVIRSLSEAGKLAHKNKPESFKHTDESKRKLRDARLKWMKENPEKTAWRTKNISYPERIFQEKLIELGLDKKYLIVRERSVFPYFIDFAFENEKVAVEIDGSQHELEEIKKKDELKDLKLKENGWRIFRIQAKQLLNDRDLVIDELLEFIGSPLDYKNCGLILEKVNKEKRKLEIAKEKEENFGLTKKRLNTLFSQERKVERPHYDILMQEVKVLGYSETGRKYGVSDNAIRKWIKVYEKYSLVA